MCFFSCIPILFSQDIPSEIKTTGTIYGRVLNNENNQPVEYASVALFGIMDNSASLGTITGLNGVFKIEDVPIGAYDLEISFLGFKKTKVNQILVTPKKDEIFLGDVSLEPDLQKLEEVTVTGRRSEIIYKSDKKVITIENDLAAKGGSIVEALEEMPSVKTDMEGNLTLRGSSNYTVLIDGKPSAIKGSEALQQIPANKVEAVEIITNPSAKYDPEGEVGIINVITKKVFSDGITGVINGSYGSHDRYSADLLLNYRKNKLSFFGGFDIKYNPMKGTGYRNRSTYDGNAVISRYADMNMSIIRGKTEVNGGFNYSISNRNNLNFETNIGRQYFERNPYSNITELSDTTEYIISDSQYNREIKFATSTLNYQHLFDLSGHKLDAVLFYSGSEMNQTDLLTEEIASDKWKPAFNSIHQFSDEAGNRNEIRLKLDYTRPLRKNGKFEAGYQGKIENNNLSQDSEYQNFIENVSIHSADGISIDRNIQALYGLYTSKFSNFDYIIGLRSEYTGRNMDSPFIDSTYSFDYFNCFPSLHISYSKSKNTQLQLSYSRRINRPNIRQLNPYIQYIDEKNQKKGNPVLAPEYINSLELNYIKRIFLSFVSAELFYRQIRDIISPVWSFEEDEVLLLSYKNLDQDYSLGCEIMSSIQASEWLRLLLSSSIYRYNIQGDAMGFDVNNSSNTWNIRFGSTFNLNKTHTRIQLNGLYNGEKAGAQGNRAGFFATVLGINQEIIKNKLNATLQFRDPLSTMKFNTYSENDFFTNEMEFLPNTPIISFNVSYKFNNYKKSSKEIDNINEFDFGDDLMF